MSSLLQAVERALLRRHVPPPTHAPTSTHTTSELDASSVSKSSSRKKPKSEVQELEELWQAPGSSPGQQLQTLRGHFESCITQPSRYVEDQQLSPWMQGTRYAHRELRTHGQLQATWSKELESDIRSVVTEAGLPASATNAVVDATKRGAIADNPGVLLCQIMALQSVLEEHVGKRAIGSILRMMPSLLNTSSDTISWHYEELATMLGPDTAASLAVKAPFILSMAPFMVWSKLTFLQRLLGISIESAQAIVVRQPRLLGMTQAALESRLRELQSMARLGDKALRQLVLKQPALLSYTSATLASNLDAMGRALGISNEQTSRMLGRMPTLIMLAPSTVTAKLSAMQTLLACSPEQAASLVTKQPFVLSVSSELLAQKHEQLGQVLHTSPQGTSKVVCTNPTLLTLSTTTLARKLTLLRESVLAARDAEQHLHSAQQQGWKQQAHAALGDEHGQRQQEQEQQQQHPQHHFPTLTSPTAHGYSTRHQTAPPFSISPCVESTGRGTKQHATSQSANGDSAIHHTTHSGTCFLQQDAALLAAPVYDHTHALNRALLSSSSTITITGPAQAPPPDMHLTSFLGSHNALNASTTNTAPSNPPPPHTSTNTGAGIFPAHTTSSTTNPSIATRAPSRPPQTSTTKDTDPVLANTNPSTADARQVQSSPTQATTQARRVQSFPTQATTQATHVHGSQTQPTNPSMASAWLSQLETFTPQQRAALACFSKERFERLPQLAAARAQAHGRQQGQHDPLQKLQQQQQQRQQAYEQPAAQLQLQQVHEQSAVQLQQQLVHEHHQLQHLQQQQQQQQQQAHEQAAPLMPKESANAASASTSEKRKQDKNSAGKRSARKGPARKGAAGLREGVAADRIYSLAAVLRMTEDKYRAALAQEEEGG